MPPFPHRSDTKRPGAWPGRGVPGSLPGAQTQSAGFGETAILQERLEIHQGVKLGGDPDPAGRRARPRRASIVGRVTIGARSRIGGNVWRHRDVPPDTLVEAGAVTRRVIGADGDDRVG